MKTTKVRTVFIPRSRLAPMLALALLASAFPSRASADKASKQLYQKTLRGTCYVSTPKVGSGTAWVVDKDKKLIVTNHHVVESEDEVFLVFPLFKEGKLVAERIAYKDERGVRGKVLDTDIERDLAVIQAVDDLPEGTVQLKLAPDSAEPSDQVHSIGNPGASDALWVYTSGTVRQVHRLAESRLDFKGKRVIEEKCKVVQTQSPINPGDSGGPVVSDEGLLTGVNSSARVRQHRTEVRLVSFAIDIAEVRSFVEQTRRLMQSKTAADHVLHGQRLEKRQKYDDAIAAYSAAIKLNRNLAAAYRQRGLCFGLKGDYDTTIVDCNEAIRLDPDDAISYENRGRAYEDKKDLDKAVLDYTKGIQLDTKFARAYNNRGVVYFKRKEFNRALGDFTQAIRADAKFAMAYANRADTYLEFRMFKEAFADADKAVDLNPFIAHAWNVRGWVLRDMGRHDDHIENFKMALVFDKDSPSYLTSLGHAFTFKKQYVEALACYTKALEIDKNHAAAYYCRGWLFEDLGLLGPCQDKQAVRLNPIYKDRLKAHNRCLLKVQNKTKEKIRVYVQYEYLTDKGKWYWYPDQSDNQNDWRIFEIDPGKVAQLVDNNWQVECRRCRIWAVGLDSNRRLIQHQEAVWLCPQEGYWAHKTMPSTYTFNGN